jgi:hypothetical protein
MRLEVEEDAAALQRLARDLEALWDSWRAAPHPGEKWTDGLNSWRARFELLPARNDRRPSHGIVEFMPAARSAIGEACEALAWLADARERSMSEEAGKRMASRVIAAAEARVNEALSGLDRAAGRPEPGPDAERVRAAIGILRAAPARLRAWHDAWRAGRAGTTTAEWSAERDRVRGDLVEALFLAGRAAPPAAYADLAEIARLLVSDPPPASVRNPSLLAAYASRILKETQAPLDEDRLWSIGQELERRLGRVERVLESK